PFSTLISAPSVCRPRMCWSTGREPIAQPPGSDTSAWPKRATSGPSTRIEARMVRTRSYGAMQVLVVRGSTCIFMRSSSTSCTPIWPSSSMKVVTSCRCGTLPMLTGSSASRQAARIGSTAFLAPEMPTSPWSGTPPLIRILAIKRPSDAGKREARLQPQRRAAASSGVRVFSASAWIAPPIRSPRVAYTNRCLASGSLPANWLDTTVASKCTPSAPSTSTRAPGRPASINACMRLGSIGRSMGAGGLRSWISARRGTMWLAYDVKMRTCHGNGILLAQKRQRTRFQLSRVDSPPTRAPMNARIAPPVPTDLSPEAIMRSARTVIATEATAIHALEPRIGTDFVEACRLILACKGRVVVSGMGKSGHVARKIAATLASTGTPAFFVHPGEASHGDLGMILPQDVVLALSYSGETDELLFILPVIKRQGIPLIAITGRPDSSLASQADVHLDGSISSEACPLGLAPTTSTTAAL